MHFSPPVAFTAVRSNAVGLLLLIQCSLMLPLFVGSEFIPCYSILYVVFFSSFAIIWMRMRELVVYLMSCNYKCSMAITRDAMGWSAVCDYGNTLFLYSLNAQCIY